MKHIPVLICVLIAMSCSTGEKGTATNDSTVVDTTKVAAIPATPEVKAAPAYDKDILVNILVRDYYLPKDATAELTSSSTIQLDQLGKPNKIQGIALVYETTSGELNEAVDMVMLAFFDVSTETPTLIAQNSVGERMNIVTFGTVELTPGQFAVSVTFSNSRQSFPVGKTVDEERDEVTYYALSGDKVVPIFDYLSIKKSVEKNGESIILETTGNVTVETGALEEGSLCSISLTITGTSDNQVTGLEDLEPTTRVYTFDGERYK